MRLPSEIRRQIGVRHPGWSGLTPRILPGIADFMRTGEVWNIATENSSVGEMETIRLDADWRGDGLILYRSTEEELAAFRARGISVVITSSEGPDGGFPRVVPDNELIGRLAARHLVECALPHFAFLARGETLYQEVEFAPGFRRYPRQRLVGFRAELAGYSADPLVHYLEGRPLWKKDIWREVQAEVMGILSKLPKPCGLFVVDDALGAVVLRAAAKLGIQIPQDLAVIGFGNDFAYCYASHPALSSIPYPALELGRKAAEVLSEMMRGRPPSAAVTLIPVAPVVPRDSTDTLGIPDPKILELVRRIHREAPGDPLRVTELAESSSLSVTTIKERFIKYLQRSPKQEIQRVRLRHLDYLLSNTSMSLAEISAAMGFVSAHEMSRFFQAGTGRRPAEYRESLKQARFS